MKYNYFENAGNEKQRDYLKMQNQCMLCGHILELQFEKIDDRLDSVDEAKEKMREHTYCPECKVQSKSRYYIIQ